MMKQRPNDLQEAYEEVMSLFLNKMPVSKMNFREVVADDLMGYGTTQEEFIRNIREYQQFIQIQEDQSKGLAMDFRRYPIHDSLSEDQKSAIIVEEITISIQAEDAVSEFTIRLSIIMEKRAGCWKMVHFHGSVPVETEEEDTWHLKEWQKEKEKLQKLVDQQTADLQLKNRELEIEAALERIRSKTMGMHKSEELADISLELVKQVQELGDETWFCAFNIYDDDPQGSLEWGSNGQGTFPKYRTPREGVFLRYYEAGQRGESLLINEIGEDECPAHYEYLCTLPGVGEQLLAMKADGIPFPSSQIDHVAYFQYGYVLFITYESVPESHEIFKRFAKVFEQSYTRFLDLKKAEAQAREAQIEASLERIRARSMAMQNSDELSDVLAVLFRQFDILGIKPLFAHLTMFDIENNNFSLRITGREGQRVVVEQHIDLDALPVWKDAFEEWKVAEPQTVNCIYYPQEMLPQTFELLEEIFAALPEGSEMKVEDFPDGAYTVQGHFKYGYLGFNNSKPPTEDQKDIVSRFATEFGRVYQRFLDLEKAEAQAREAQIEVALEKVRAQSLAMHSSNEMQQVADALYEQLDALGIEMDIAGMSGVIESLSDYIVWGSHFSEPLVIPYNAETQLQREYNKAIEKRPRLFSRTFTGKVKKEYIDHLISHAEIPPDLRKLMIESKAKTTSIAFSENSSLQIVRYNDQPYSDEDNELLVRFAKVFEQAYIRFLDLEKAEKQAKESEIQLALERVRARSLAMHQSSEMQQVANEVYKQMKELGLQMDAVGMSGQIEPYTDYEVWIGGSDFEAPVIIPFTDSTKVQRDYNAVIESRPELFCNTYSGKDKKEYTDFLLSQSQFPEELKKRMVESESFSTSITFRKNSSIQVATYSDQAYTDKENELLKRFGRVFEQAYIRFMDLEKAEKQARESEIQLSLERVRARSMSMHKSEELNDVLSILFDQFYLLGIEPVNVFLSLFSREDKTLTYRATGTGGSRTQGQQVVSLDSMEVWQELFEKWKNDNSDSVEVIYYEKEILPTLFGLLEETFSAMPEKERLSMDHFPDGGYTAHGYTPFGYIGYNHTRMPTDEEKEILTKFASEFSRVYQRFLDIERAEAQARESEIQLALEKVRARSMAMHQSDELTDLLSVLFEQFDVLGIKPIFAHLTLFDQGENLFSFRMTGFEGQRVLVEYIIDVNEMEAWKDAYRQWKEEEENSINCIDYHPEMLPDLFDIMKPIFDALPDGSEMSIDDYPNGIFTTQANCKYGYLGFNHKRRATEEEQEIVVRFAKEFGRAYQRFLDIKQAEAQAKESEIQLALERVRARTMAMHNSEELGEVAAVLFEQIGLLTENPDRFQIAIAREADKTFDIWVTDQEGKKVSNQFSFSSDRSPVVSEVFKAWQQKEDILIQDLHGKKLKNWISYFSEEAGLPLMEDHIKDHRYINSVFFTHGCIGTTTNEPLKQDTLQLLERFTQVFQQTYIRFLDLQKAEAQAREANIEAALERVRSRSLAMHKTDELQDVVRVVAEELKNTGVILDTGGAVICTYFQDSKDVIHWTATEDPAHPSVPYLLPYFENELFDEAWESKNRGDNYFAKVFSYDVKNAFFNHAFEHSDYRQLPDEYKKIILESKSHGLAWSWAENSAIMIPSIQGDLPSEEERKILIRFAKVFEQSFIRFLDLQKAEEQAKKAEIEASLERVRAKAMAMHSSKDIEAATAVVFNELSRLGIDMERCGITLMNETPVGEIWSTPLSRDNKEVIDIITGYLDFRIHPILQNSHRDWREKKDFSAYKLVGDEVKKYYTKLENQPEYKFPKVASYPDQQILHTFYFKEGGIFAFTVDELSAESKDIIQKFTTVFAQTYTRFLDIQKAEAQAREAKIETALEKVRSRTMGMQSSDELPEVANMLFLEVQGLGIPAWSSGFNILDKDNKSAAAWMSSEGTLQDPFKLRLHGEASFDEMWNFIKSNKTMLVQELSGDALQEHYKYMKTFPDLQPTFKKFEEQGLSLPTYQINHLCKFAHGFLLFITYEPVPDAHGIFKRFTKVFNQTYTRFLDLKRAEAQAIEATKQASLDRVRGEIASMRSAEDLNRITPLVWNELTTLSIPFIRCGVFIIHEEEEQVEVYLSKPDGTSLAVMHLPFDSSELAIQTVAAWKNSSVHKEYWTKEEFLKWGRLMMEQDQVRDMETYQGAEEPPESLNLHFIPFNRGMLYVGSTNPLSDEEIDLAASLAEAFAIAYARYEDFVQLDKAKAGIEEALNELKATQSQLIQQEKLASLGQLTAGIAHEIKNPLNFVNNFSELSVELIEEARKEIKETNSKFNIQNLELSHLLDDIENNLKTIHKHGSRADSIVKSMLGHSRGGDGKMDPTSLNGLVKEYVNLSFHGMRAGKDPINVDIEMELDESVGNVPLIAEDFSRVIINLCNNAFDAMRTLVAERSAHGKEYKPKLTIRSKKTNGAIALEIEDNGPGIPDEIKDKILQPFFTTKKGTEGTGLGLSITNDIIKALGGELSVNSTSGTGSTFIITLKPDE